MIIFLLNWCSENNYQTEKKLRQSTNFKDSFGYTIIHFLFKCHRSKASLLLEKGVLLGARPMPVHHSRPFRCFNHCCHFFTHKTFEVIPSTSGYKLELSCSWYYESFFINQSISAAINISFTFRLALISVLLPEWGRCLSRAGGHISNAKVTKTICTNWGLQPIFFISCSCWMSQMRHFSASKIIKVNRFALFPTQQTFLLG